MQSFKVLSTAGFIAAVLAVAGAPAFAQSAPSAPGAQAHGQRGERGGMNRTPDFARYAPMALRMAYDAIGRAQADDGGNPAVASAKSHYTAGLARLAKNDAQGAVGEAHAAMAYAGLAMTRRTHPTPTGIAAPPAMADRNADDGASRAYASLSRLTREQNTIAKVAAIASTEETTRLAGAASAAENAAERAVASKNYTEADKQASLAGRLDRTLVAVAAIDHEQQVRALMPRGMGMRGRGGPGGMMHGGPGGPGGPGGMMRGGVGEDDMAPPIIGDDMEGPPPPFPGDDH